MAEPLQRLIRCDDGTRENREDDGQAGEILHSAQAIRKPPSHAAPPQPEGDRERDRGRGVGKVVNRVREETHAPRHDHDDYLEKRGHEETGERPFQRPQSTLVRGDRWIDHSVRVAVAARMTVASLAVMPVLWGIVVTMVGRIARAVIVGIVAHLSPPSPPRLYASQRLASHPTPGHAINRHCREPEKRRAGQRGQIGTSFPTDHAVDATGTGLGVRMVAMTTSPDANVSAATRWIAAPKPTRSATAPESSAPIA